MSGTPGTPPQHAFRVRLRALGAAASVAALVAALGCGSSSAGDAASPTFENADPAAADASAGGASTGMLGDSVGGALLLPGAGGSGGEFVAPAAGAGGASCGSISIDADVEEVVTPGNLLVIYDQSLSMGDNWNGQPRWKAASEAVLGGIDKVKDYLTIGAVFFPSEATLAVIRNLSCDVGAVAPIDDTEAENPQIPFMSGANFIEAWTEHWKSNPLRFGTPTQSGLERGLDALEGASLVGPTAIVLVTDGEPTCGTEMAEKQLVEDAAARGVPTYVVGIPGSQSAAKLLDSLAKAGGTEHFLAVDQVMELEGALTNITRTVVKRSIDSCEISFTAPPADPSRVFLVVTDAVTGATYQVASGPDGWTLDATGRKATLEGATCEDARAGRFAHVSFEFGCVDEPVLIR